MLRTQNLLPYNLANYFRLYVVLFRQNKHSQSIQWCWNYLKRTKYDIWKNDPLPLFYCSATLKVWQQLILSRYIKGFVEWILPKCLRTVSISPTDPKIHDNSYCSLFWFNFSYENISKGFNNFLAKKEAVSKLWISAGAKRFLTDLLVKLHPSNSQILTIILALRFHMIGFEKRTWMRI